ncbi:hypothetical protein, partial [Planotetraspora phitsanulokensis]|uniref:hypothetical protein n=1 Tax=Planotetraspora phitsanulokensis TaxID=575192 RepID=UPI0031E6F5F5
SGAGEVDQIQSDPAGLAFLGSARPSSLYGHSVRVLGLVEQSSEPLAGPQDVPTSLREPVDIGRNAAAC